MARDSQTFSESWHRVARSRVSLRPAVRCRRHHFRGERWHVLEDPFSNQFFRLRPAAYDFVARLDGTKTVEECWRESLLVHPEEAPGQEEVVQLLAQMFHANLIRSDQAPDLPGVFQRYRKRRHREIRTKLQSILFFRAPLFNPQGFLTRTLPAADWLFGRFGLILWLLVTGAALKTVVDHWPEATDQSGSVLSPANLPLLYVAMAFIKLLHELGHGYACRKFGGEVPVLGLMLLVFTPVPYVDASSSWRFRSRWQRVIVSAAGMYVELLIAALAVFVWAATDRGMIHSLAYNVMFVASVSTVLFNLNPLIRFDGYFIVTDLLGIPNLGQRANRQWKHLLEKHGFGLRQSVSPSNTRSGATFLLAWGAAAFCYRIVLFTGILLFVADRFLLLGVLIAATGVVSWVIVPTARALHYLLQGPRLERQRGRAVAVSTGLTTAVLLPMAVLPVPNAFIAPGILRSADYTVVFSQAAGRVGDDILPTGTTIRAGDRLITLVNPDLETEKRLLEARLAEARARERHLLTDPGQGLRAMAQHLAELEERLAETNRQIASLEVTTPVSGVWVSPRISHYRGAWLPRGAEIGEIIDPAHMEFAAVVSQKDAAYLFSDALRRTSVKLRGHAETELAVLSQRIVPAQQRLLPSPALGWSAGGEVEIASTDPTGREAAESFFELVAELDLSPVEGALFHGQSGKLRGRLPAEPLLQRGVREVRQLTQRRYGL